MGDIKQIHKMVLNGRLIRIRELAKTLRKSKEHVHDILHGELSLKIWLCIRCRAYSLWIKNAFD